MVGVEECSGGADDDTVQYCPVAAPRTRSLFVLAPPSLKRSFVYTCFPRYSHAQPLRRRLPRARPHYPIRGHCLSAWWFCWKHAIPLSLRLFPYFRTEEKEIVVNLVVKLDGDKMTRIVWKKIRE
ncbi:hypothetical protein BGY98DRAFT_1178389 [Russula aff. rugulosa BPL654]|nr:hypothetical protein BGY98DRAFT_1178389 [Russula aff. rugulosa BPL654]